MKNLLNLIECKWLKNYYYKTKTYKIQTTTNKYDKISFLYLTHFTELISYLIGHNVQKTYSIFINFNNTQNIFYDDDDQNNKNGNNNNKYTLLLTINNKKNEPFPIYINQKLFHHHLLQNIHF